MVEDGYTDLRLKLQCGEEAVLFINPYPRQGSPFSCRTVCEASAIECHNGRDMVSTPVGGKVEFETSSGHLIAASCEFVKEEISDIDALSFRLGRDESDDINRRGTPRKKLRLSKYQSRILEESFREHSTLSPKHKSVLANKLNLQPRQVEVWFQNRKARTKLRRKEVERENLERCYESLKEENRRLERKVQALRAMEIVEEEDLYTQSPNSMPFVAATLTMCQSCERLATKTTTATIAL